MLPSAAELVARYLRANGYDESLKKFIEEAELSPDVGSSVGTTIEQILEEKKKFDLSLNFEKLGLDDTQKGWRHPAPSTANVLSSLPTKSNIISACMLDILLPESTQPKRCVAATTADRRLELLDPHLPSFPVIRSYSEFQDSPLLDLAIIDDRLLLAGAMSGKLFVYNTATDEVTDERKDHSKYIVKLATWCEPDYKIIASAGWDSKVYFYKLNSARGQNARLGEPVASLALQSIPETILFIKHPETDQPVLLLSRRDSTHLHYYELTVSASAFEVTLLGKQNLAPHSNAWIVFSPSDIQLCPTDPSIAAIATSSTPHMKLLVVRLLVPRSRHATVPTSGDGTQQGVAAPSQPELDTGGTEAPLTQAAQARAQLLIQDREEAAIIINTNTMAPQTAYSTPKLTWRPDGSGIYVTSDDGVIRGFEASTGKLVASLDAHERGSKVRCVWAGAMTTPEEEYRECLISGGFDQKLILWSTASDETSR